MCRWMRLALYLNEIGGSKLLTAEEEVYYARLAQKGEHPAPSAHDREQSASGGKDRTALYESGGWRCWI